jgi:hypothetical protein
MELEHFLNQAWDEYCEITPDAARVRALLESRGERLVNDHVAYRTFDLPGISRLELGARFEPWGYVRQEDLDFAEKKLTATSWLHPDPLRPKIFISELRVGEVSAELGSWIRAVVAERVDGAPSPTRLAPTWAPPAHADYARFYAESEYAAWTAAFGIRVNHFTVLVNELRSFGQGDERLPALNLALQAHGFTLNSSGGIVKGSPAEGLEQSSTVARRVTWRFREGEREIMSCYFEFAYRHPGADGRLFQGFVPASANRIFESNFERGN